MNTIAESPAFKVLDVRFNAVQIPDVIAEFSRWIGEYQRSHYVCVSNVHSVVESHHDPEFKHTLNGSDLNVPDGMPIVWLGRWRGHHNLVRRVYGPDLLQAFCRESVRRGYRQFFYGGAAGVTEAMVEKLEQAYPGLQVAGLYSPPFRTLSAEEDEMVVRMINDAEPDVLWVGLGCPKQELWMRAHRDRLRVPAMVGVGQAFNIAAGTLPQAPSWMREHGLEWFFRLLREPRRLWKRYLVYNTEFLWRLSVEAIQREARRS